MYRPDSTETGAPGYGETLTLCSDAGGGCPTVTPRGDLIEFGHTGLERGEGLHLTVEDARKLRFAFTSGQLDWIGSAS